MEQQKKRHNPPIFEEDRAVKAFDRNNDAAQVEEKPVEEKNNLEKAIQTAMTSQEEVVTKKGEGALREELTYLLTKIFGEDIYVKYIAENRYKLLKNSYDGKASNTHWPLAKLKQKGSWFKYEVYEEIAKITQLKKGKGEDSEDNRLPIYEDSRFNPIKITAYTPEGLRKSKLFAKAYKAFTGQDVTVVRECVDEEEMKQAGLEGVVEKTPEVRVKVEGDLLGTEKTVYAGNKKISINVNNREWFDNFSKYLEQTFAPKYRVILIKRSSVLPFHCPAFKIIDHENGQVAAKVKYDDINLDFSPRSSLTVKVYDSRVIPEVINLKEHYEKITNRGVTVYGNI